MAKNGKAEQVEFKGEGMERKVDKEIEKLASTYVDMRDTRMELTTREVEAKAALLAKMHEKGMTSYSGEDFTIEIEPSEKVKVKRVEEDDEPEE